jgi:hypothetical protein
MMRAPILFKYLSILSIAWTLSGCRIDGDTRDGATSADNSPPKISGAPTTRTKVGRTYRFRPAASDPDGDPISFAVANKPAWTTFDPTSGELRGTPRSSDIGRHRDVTISVSDGKTTRVLPKFDVVVTTVAATNNALMISGSPSTYVEAGLLYSFTPSTTQRNAGSLVYSIENKPSWASFDTTTGTISGTPSAAHVGKFPDVTILASDGENSSALPPFTISVVPAATRSTSSAPFAFAEVPEISFVQSFAESEHLGIFHIDTTNRWTPGDLNNDSGWTPRIGTQLEILQGTLQGVNYDSGTGILSYDGKGGAGWALVQLSAPSFGARSKPFFVRVLIPDAIWGQDATTRPDIASKFPTVPKFDYGRESYVKAWESMPTSGTADDPDVLLILGGTYLSATEARLTDQVEADTGLPKSRVNWASAKGGARPWQYLIGEPGNRPKLSGYDIESGAMLSVNGYRVSVGRNLELEAMVTTTANGGWQVGVPNRKYWSRIFAHSQHGLNRPQWPDKNAINDDLFGSSAAEGDTADHTARYGVPIAPNDWKSFFWNNEFIRTGGSPLKHTIYLHGRPDAWLIYNNNRHNGGNSSSAVKATVGHFRVLNSRISAFPDETNPADPAHRLNQQLLDVPSSSDSVIYNNHLVGGHRWNEGHAGTRTGLIWFSPRRTLWGTDLPRYPDVTYQAAPFRNFAFSFNNSGVAGADYPNATLEIRSRGGNWRPTNGTARFSPNGAGGGSNWELDLSPSDFGENGNYELRMNGGAAQSPAYMHFSVYRNARYLAITSYYDAQLDRPWYADGPKAYVIDDGAEYWTQMMRWGATAGDVDARRDATNPYTLKKYVAYNRFTWLTTDGLMTKREEAIRDNGTLPSYAVYIGSNASRFGAVPPTWTDAGVTFLANNVYEGWQVEDLGTADFLRSDVGAITGNPANQLYGPGQDDPVNANWPNYSVELPKEKQPLFVPVGGERTPASPAATEIALPDWFKLP